MRPAHLACPRTRPSRPGSGPKPYFDSREPAQVDRCDRSGPTPRRWLGRGGLTRQASKLIMPSGDSSNDWLTFNTPARQCYRCARHLEALACGQGAGRRAGSGTTRRHECVARDDAHSSRCDHAVAITVEHAPGKHRRRRFGRIAGGCRGCRRRRRSDRFTRHGHGGGAAQSRGLARPRRLRRVRPGQERRRRHVGPDAGGPTTSGGAPLPGSTPDPVTGNYSGFTPSVSAPFGSTCWTTNPASFCTRASSSSPRSTAGWI